MCSDVDGSRMFHRLTKLFEKLKFQSSARSKRGIERGAYPGEMGQKAQDSGK